MTATILLVVKPYWCADCEAVLGWDRTWDDTMPVGTVNEPCPNCGSHRIAVIPIGNDSSTSTKKTEEES